MKNKNSLTATQVAAICSERMPGMAVTSVRDAGDSYMVMLCDKNNMYEDYSNAIYLVSKRDGSIKHFSPTTDLDRYSRIMRTEELFG